MKEEIDNGNIVFGEDEKTIPSVRRNMFEKNDQVMRSVKFSYAQKTAQDFASLFDGNRVFDNPKDPNDLKSLIEYLVDEDGLILDFFAGSCTTAHAVFLANHSDGLRRRFLCVQLPEKLDTAMRTHSVSTEFCNAQGIDLTISAIARERIVRAGLRVAGKNRPETGSTTDVGFRAFSLAETNIKKWVVQKRYLSERLFDSVDNIRSDRSDADLVNEIILKYGLDLNSVIEVREVAYEAVHIVEGGALIVCLSNNISLDLVNGIADFKEELAPEIMRVVFKDNGFVDDVVKTNALQILRQAGVDDVKSL